MTCDLVCKTFSLMFFLVPHPPFTARQGLLRRVAATLRDSARHCAVLVLHCMYRQGRTEMLTTAWPFTLNRRDHVRDV